MANILYSPLAQNDLEQLWLYIAEKLESPIVAGKSIEKVTKAIRSLGRFPLSGESLEARSGRKTDLRFTVGGKRVIVYRYEQTNDTLYIIRVFGKGENWLETLFFLECDG